MEENVVGMRKSWFITQTGIRPFVGRIIDNPVMQFMGITDRVVAVVAEPVVHTHAKPGIVANHIPGTLPQVESARKRTHPTRIGMALKDKVERSWKGNYQHQERHNNCQPPNEQEFAIANVEGDDKKASHSDRNPGTV